MGGYKNQLTGEYDRKFSVSNICHIKLIIYFRKFTTVNILGYISHQEIWMTTGTYKVSIKSLAKHKWGLFKVKYLSKLSQYFKNLWEAIMRLYKKTLAKLLKYWLTLISYSTLKSSSFMFCEKFNWNLQSVSWILAEFCYNRSPQGPYTGTCTILQETINGFLCPLIVFRKM